MRKLLLLAMVAMLLLAVSGCGGGTKDAAAPAGGGNRQESQTVGDMPEQKKMEMEDDGQSGVKQKIIRSINMVLVVSDVEKAVSEIDEILQSVNGYVQDANLWQSNGRPQGTFTLRLPVEMVDETLPRLESLGQVERKNISGEDVTEEYYDTEARKNNLKKQEERYLELLNKANTVQDMLEIENQLARLRGEIESFEARLKVLDNRVDLATINVELRSPKGLSTGETLREPFGQRIQAGWQRGINGMVNFVQDLFVLMVIMLPYTPVFAVGGYIAYRLYKMRMSRKDSNIRKD